MSGKVGFGSDVLGLKNFNFEKINEKRIKPFEDKVKKIQDTIELTTDTNKARGELKTLTNELEKSLRNVLLQTHAKSAHIMKTNEERIGASGDDYLDVTASGNSHICELEVSVRRLATYAFTSLQKINGVGFNIVDLFADDTLNISITTNPGKPSANIQNITVENLGNKNITEVITRINAKLKLNNAKAEAVLEPRENGLYNIKIISTLTGSRKIKFLPEDGIYYIPTCADVNNVQGKNANVVVNGRPMSFSTNIIKLGKDAAGADIPNHIAQGITLTLKKENTQDLHNHYYHQTIRIEQDKNIIGDKLGEFVDAYNNLKKFIAAQEKRNARGDGYEEEAYLARTRELAAAKNLLYSMLDRIDVEGLQKVKSLASIGVLHGQNGLTINSDRLKDIVDTDFDEIVKFFNDAKGFGVNFLKNTGKLLELIDTEAKKVTEKLINGQVEHAKAEIAMQKERKKIDEEMAQIEIINMQASMMQMYFEAMMSQS